MRSDAGVPELERRLVEAARTGAMVDLCTGEPDVDAVSNALAWDANRVVRAEFVVGLLTGDGSSRDGPPRAVKLRGARVTGHLDLEAAFLLCPLLLQDCYLEEVIDLCEAQASALRLRGCCVPGINASQLHTRGNLEFCDGSAAHRGVNLVDAHVGGSLLLDGANLASDNGESLQAARIIVDGTMSCGNGFTAHNGVDLLSAYIKGSLNFSAASLTNRDGPALQAARIKVEDAAFFRDGFTAQGEVSMRNSRFASFVDFANARLSNPDGIALNLAGVYVGGSLVLDRADLSSDNGDSLHAARIIVDGTMSCGNGFTAHNGVNLINAHIKGSLDFSAASLAKRDGPALLAARIKVDDAVFFRNGFTAEGEVNIRNSEFASFVDFADARLNNPDRIALRANGVTVRRGVSFKEGFTANGAVTLADAHVGRLYVEGGSFKNPDGIAIDLQGIRASSLLLLPSERPDGAIDLSAAQVTNFCDDPETWPTKLHLRDFTYEILENDTVNVRSRLNWLALHGEGYVPGIYDQLASTYRRAGAVEESRIVSIVKQKRRRRKLNPIGQAWNWLLYLTVGYGYRTWWAALWLLGLLTIGSVIFAQAYPKNMVPAAGVVPAFQPVAYTIDVLVPLVDLGQKKAWVPKGTAMIWSWMLTSWGWVLTTAVVAGLTNALKRD